MFEAEKNVAVKNQLLSTKVIKCPCFFRGFLGVPSGKTNIAMEKTHCCQYDIYRLNPGPCSIAMVVYESVFLF